MFALTAPVAACGGPHLPSLGGDHAASVVESAPVAEAMGTLPVQRSSLVELVWSSDGGAQRLIAPAGLAVDGQGALIVVDADADRLVRLDGATGQGLVSWGGRGNAAGQFRFAPPPDPSPPFGLDRGLLIGSNVAVGADGQIIVADSLNHRIQVFDPHGQFSGAWGSSGVRPGQFSQPDGLGIDAHGHLYVADRWNHRVQKFERAGAPLLTWGSPGSAEGEFSMPVAVAVDRRGQVFVLDAGNDRVQVFDGEGRFRAVWGALGREPAEFVNATALAVDSDGRVYVADGGNYRVQVFTGAGVFLGAWGEPGVGPGQFAAVSGIAVDDQGAIYVSDGAVGRVQKFQPRAAWPAAPGTPTPRPALPTPTPDPARHRAPLPSMTPTDR
jgi:DNA-binding beta-propeller fold protein YncE